MYRTRARMSSVIMLLVLTEAILLSGCAPKPSTLDPQSAQFNGPQAKCSLALANPGVPLAAQGALLVGAVGALAGGLAGGGRGAVIGGLSGAALGGLGGAALQAKQDAYATAESEMGCRMSAAYAEASALRGEVAYANRAATQVERQMAPLRLQVSTGRSLNDQQKRYVFDARAESDKWTQRLKSANADLRELNLAIEKLRKEGQSTFDLEQQRNSIAASVRHLEDVVSRMDRAMGQVEA